MRANFFVIAAFLFASLFLASGCSQGDNNSRTAAPPPPPPPPTNSGPTWTQGVFEPSSEFEDRCEVVRTGLDIEGNPFPDMAGSILEENFWLRSWTHETYLWNDEVVDRNPANFDDPIEYFALLKTEETTASGKPKDEFHFTQPTDEFLEQRNSAPSATYGAVFVAISATPPRDIRVLYTESGSPAADTVMGEANLIRGTRILEVDGVDVVNANTQAEVDMINDGLFPATAGETHSFQVEDPGGAPRMIMMTSANLAPEPVNRTKVIDTGSGKIGYILLNTFSPFASEEDIADAITEMDNAGVADLVLDLRYNGGGLVAVASQLAYMVAGDAQTNGKVFSRLEFNDDAGNLNPVTGEINEPVPFFDTGLGFSLAEGTPLDTLNLSRVFILSTENTCSASESVINALRGIDVEVILIGDTTCGKPFGFFPEDNCGVTYFTIQFRDVNDKGFGDFADGFTPANSGAAFGVDVPGCAVNDDLGHELGDENEALLAAALQYRDTVSCPTPPMTASAGVTTSSVETAEAGLALSWPEESVMSNNRDMTMPE